MVRTLAAVLALIVTVPLARGADLAVREVGVPGPDGGVRVRCYSAPADSPRPVVVLLHGATGFAPFARHYEGYAEALAPHGFRTCAVLYYSTADARVIAGTNRAAASNLFQKRFTAWVSGIHRAVDHVRDLPSTDPGAIGILGFSQGGYLAVAVAGTHRSVKALAEFYGGFPFPLVNQITRLPPTLIVHGEADTVIPVQEAQALEAIARERAPGVTTKLYPGAGHGFDLQSDDPRAADARKETVDFFVRHLKAGAK